jgi:hypothetical protein
VTAICGNLDGVVRDSIETTFFGLRKTSSSGCSLDEVAVSGGAAASGTDIAALQRSIALNSEDWSGRIRSYDNPDFTLRVSTLCVPADDDISVLSLSSTTAATETKQISIVCPEGRRVLGGGAEAVEDEELRAALTTSAPLFEDGKVIGWHAAGHVIHPSTPPWRLDVKVTCPEAAPATIAWLALAALGARRH